MNIQYNDFRKIYYIFIIVQKTVIMSNLYKHAMVIFISINK